MKIIMLDVCQNGFVISHIYIPDNLYEKQYQITFPIVFLNPLICQNCYFSIVTSISYVFMVLDYMKVVTNLFIFSDNSISNILIYLTSWPVE